MRRAGRNKILYFTMRARWAQFPRARNFRLDFVGCDRKVSPQEKTARRARAAWRYGSLVSCGASRFAALSAGAEQSAVFKECQCEENPHEDVLQKAIRPVPVTNQPGAALKSVKRPADEQKNVRASHRNSFQDRK